VALPSRADRRRPARPRHRGRAHPRSRTCDGPPVHGGRPDRRRPADLCARGGIERCPPAAAHRLLSLLDLAP
jgi:hypothetical protein